VHILGTPGLRYPGRGKELESEIPQHSSKSVYIENRDFDFPIDRGYSFALHQVQQAIEPHLSFQQTLYSWNQIAEGLAKKSRNRLLQLAKWHPS
jgi:hypothetical protein